MWFLCVSYSDAVTFSVMNMLNNKSLEIRNYVSVIHLKDVHSLQAIMNNILVIMYWGPWQKRARCGTYQFSNTITNLL